MNINVIWLDIAKRTFHLVDKVVGAHYMLHFVNLFIELQRREPRPMGGGKKSFA